MSSDGGGRRRERYAPAGAGSVQRGFLFRERPRRIDHEHNQFAQFLVARAVDLHRLVGHPGHRGPGIQDVHAKGRVLGQLPRQDQERLRSRVAVDRGLGPNRRHGIVDPQQEAVGIDPRHRTDRCDRRTAPGGRLAVGQSEEPGLVVEFSRQRVVAGGGFRRVEGAEILDMPVELALRQDIDVHLGHLGDDELADTLGQRRREAESSKCSGCHRSSDWFHFNLLCHVVPDHRHKNAWSIAADPRYSRQASEIVRPAGIRAGSRGLSRLDRQGQSFGSAALMSRNEAEITTKSEDCLCLGRLWFDRKNGELRDADGSTVELRRQSNEVLAKLAERPRHTVSKDDLIEAIWPDVAVTDDSLVQCIGDIRRTLGPEARDCVQTVRRRGYGLVPSAPAHGAALADASQPSGSPPRRSVVALASGLLLAVAALWLAILLPRDEKSLPTARDRPVIVVLPFENTNADPEQQYFIDGLSEDLSTDLSRVSGLTMISSASGFALHDADAPPERAARQLGATHVLTGSVRREKRRLRVNATLIDVASGETVWADRYDRDVGGVFELQDDVSRAVTSALAIELTASEQARFDRQQTVDADAYDLLLRGLAPHRTFTGEGNSVARELFRRAMEIDPTYARAHAALALTYGTSFIFRLGDDPADLPLALEFAETAVRLDPTLPQAQFALAVLMLADRRHDAAVEAAREAIRLDPNYADGYAVLAQTLAYGGDKSEALDAIRTAKTLSPRYAFAYLWVEGHILLQLRRYEEARVVLEEVLSRNPAFVVGHLTLAATYGHLRLADKADWLVMELLTLAPDVSAFNEGQSAPYREVRDRAHYIEGLLLAGVPE